MDLREKVARAIATAINGYPDQWKDWRKEAETIIAIVLYSQPKPVDEARWVVEQAVRLAQAPTIQSAKFAFIIDQIRAELLRVRTDMGVM